MVVHEPIHVACAENARMSSLRYPSRRRSADAALKSMYTVYHLDGFRAKRLMKTRRDLQTEGTAASDSRSRNRGTCDAGVPRFGAGRLIAAARWRAHAETACARFIIAAHHGTTGRFVVPGAHRCRGLVSLSVAHRVRLFNRRLIAARLPIRVVTISRNRCSTCAV